MTFVMAVGGTGGHVLPGLAVARELQRRGHSVVFVGTERGMESKLVPAAGFALRFLRIGAWSGVSWARRALTLVELPAAFLAAAGLLARLQPHAVFSMGGYASGPVMLAAWARGVPLIVMEPNAVPGLANRLIAPLAARALLGFEEAGRFFPHARWEVTGIPIREEFFQVGPKGHAAPFMILITGGSQGSHRLNLAASESLPHWQRAGWLERIEFVHQTGEREYNDVCSRYQQAGARAQVTPFVPNMPAAFARADLIVCRSGASTVAELCAAGRASILSPFPFAAGQHQLCNARALESAGAARIILDSEMTGERLFEVASGMLENPAVLPAMEEAARRLARPGAASRAADFLEGSLRA